MSPARQQRPDPVVDLRSHVERWAGAEPADCGRHVLTRRDIRWIAADEAALEDSVACGLAAAAGHSAPCGGSGCASRISFEQCDRPVAATDALDHSVFRCLNAWADVQSPERFQ